MFAEGLDRRNVFLKFLLFVVFRSGVGVTVNSYDGLSQPDSTIKL
ncbi:Uncharacterised protein [Oligella urethralis]|nr:Uncharacterised protein [Oligella urethralis]SUA64293.1 Uncharacterised protein [Oligella urethralis]